MRDFISPKNLSMFVIPPGICYSHDTWQQYVGSPWKLSSQFCSNICYFVCLFAGAAVIPVSVRDMGLSDHNIGNMTLKRKLYFLPVISFIRNPLALHRLINTELLLEVKSSFYLFCFCTGHAMERATWMGFPPNPAIAHSGSVCLSCCAEAVYNVFLRQIWWAINEYKIRFLKPVLHTESWSCWCEPMTHSQSYGSCLQCQEQELFPSDYFLEHETEKIISKVLGIDRKH